MIRRKALLAALVLSGTLAGCKGSEKPSQDAKAVGEVLPGSISDAMLPIDTVRSQPPLAPASASGKGSKGKGGAGGDAETPEVGPGAEDAPSISLPPASPAAQ